MGVKGIAGTTPYRTPNGEVTCPFCSKTVAKWAPNQITCGDFFCKQAQKRQRQFERDDEKRRAKPLYMNSPAAQEIREMRARGWTIRKISQETQYHPASIRSVINQYENQPQ
jgi:hypothetical protein